MVKYVVQPIATGLRHPAWVERVLKFCRLPSRVYLDLIGGKGTFSGQALMSQSL